MSRSPRPHRNLLFLLLLLPLPVSAQLTSSEQTEIIEEIISQLSQNYVYPSTADAMAANLRSQAQSGAYAEIDDPSEFARQLTLDLRGVSEDLHLAIYDPARRAQQQTRNSPPPANVGGPVHAEILEGNIGLLRISQFVPQNQIEGPLREAMRQVADTDALLIDLRNNGGGSPASAMLLAGYLIPERTLVAQIYSRPNDQSQEMWTVPVNELHYTRDVWILTNEYTGSAAEAAAYHLKHLGAARTVGENSAGAAHRISRAPLPHGLEMTVPFTRPINVVTGGDWEGTGVVPDVEAPEEEALRIAQIEALRGLPVTAEREALIGRLGGG